MNENNIYEIFQKNFYKCLKEENSGRSILIKRCLSVFLNAKTNYKKFFILIGQTMFEDAIKYNGEIILNSQYTTDSIIKLFNDSYKNELKIENFEQYFFNLTKTMKFFYELSKIYSILFPKKRNFHEVFLSFIFKKKYEEDKLDCINSIINYVSSNLKEKYKYEELLNLIEQNYIETNDFISEFVKLFLDNDSKYITQIKEKLSLKDAKSGELPDKNNKHANHLIFNEIKENEKINNDENSQNIDISYISQHNNRSNISNIKPKNNIKDEVCENCEKINIIKMKEESKIKGGLKINDEPKIGEESKTSESKKSDATDNDKKLNSNHKENIAASSEQKETTLPSDKENIINLKKNLKTVRDYLNEQYNKYKNDTFEPLSLKRILEKNKIEYSDISYAYHLKKLKIELNPDNKINDKILDNLLNKLKFENGIPDPTQFGYFCYKINNRTIEALYSIIDPETLYNNIIKCNKYDNYNNPSKEIEKQYSSIRAKSFEYFINKSVFQKKYGNRPYPRIIFPLQSVFINKRNEYIFNDKIYDPEVEIDGCFFVEDNFTLQKDVFPFESQYFNTYFNNLDLDCENNKNGYMFLKNDLCLIEVKTRFPVNKNVESYFINEKDLYETVIDILNKMIIYEKLFQELQFKYNRIRVILFYDVVKKYNYEKTLERALKNFSGKNNNLNYLDKIYLQIIYMDSSYFAESLKSFEDKIDNMEYRINELKLNLTEEKNKRKNLEEIILLMSKNMDEDMKKKINEIIKK